MQDDPIALPRHGGALAQASARYGLPLDAWLDLSTGINPTPYPVGVTAPSSVHRLPDPQSLESLLRIARKAYGLTEGGAIAACPGSDLALRLLPLIAPEGPVAILGPTYSGHAEAWTQAGRSVSMVSSLDDVPPEARIVVIVNPNNPDGRIVPSDALKALADHLGAAGGLLVLDEAFADVTPATSFVPLYRGERVVMLRSFGKFYGLAGMRLGFLMGDRGIVERFSRLIGDWPVSGPAIAIGASALADRPWQQETRARLADARSRLVSLLEAASLSVMGGTDLFLLTESPEAVELHVALARQGIWTRIFQDQPGRIRFGLPADDAFARFATALQRS
jgi:cobalamin biosynthetic protein CobC